MTSSAAVCPVVGTTNTVLPPSHPDVDMDRPGQVCPVVGASTDNHKGLHKHPKVTDAATGSSDATSCPALKEAVKSPQNEARSEAVCPVVGNVTRILPPSHPPTAANRDDDVCPVTKARIDHHKGLVSQHPLVERASENAVYPVSGVSKE